MKRNRATPCGFALATLNMIRHARPCGKRKNPPDGRMRLRQEGFFGGAAEPRRMVEIASGIGVSFTILPEKAGRTYGCENISNLGNLSRKFEFSWSDETGIEYIGIVPFLLDERFLSP